VWKLSVTLRKVKLRIYENTVLRRIFETNREEDAGEMT
jgi:hypothetical protein